MFFIFIIFLICLTPVLTRNSNPLLGLRIAFALMFALAAFEYGCTQDYFVPIRDYWNPMMMGTLDCEPVYAILLYIFKPLGYFIFNIFVQAFNFYVLYRIVSKYCPSQYYWLSVILFVLIMKNYFLFVNCYRQTLAVSFTMLAMETIYLKSHSIESYLSNSLKPFSGFFVSFLFVLIAGNIHTTAYLSIVFLLFPLLCKFEWFTNWKIALPVFMFIYVGRMFISSSELTLFFTSLLHNNDNRFQYYMVQVQDNEVEFTFYLQMLYIVSLTFMAIKMKDLTPYCRSLCLAILLGIMLQPFLTTDSERLMMYLTVYWIIIIPQIVSLIKIKKIKYSLILLWLLYSINNFQKNTTNMFCYRWINNFQTIFEAPQWL